MTNKHVGPLWDHCVLARGVAHIPLHARQTVRTSHSLRAQSAGRNTKREQHEAAMGRDANNETMTQSIQFGKKIRLEMWSKCTGEDSANRRQHDQHGTCMMSTTSQQAPPMMTQGRVYACLDSLSVVV